MTHKGRIYTRLSETAGISHTFEIRKQAETLGGGFDKTYYADCGKCLRIVATGHRNIRTSEYALEQMGWINDRGGAGWTCPPCRVGLPPILRVHRIKSHPEPFIAVAMGLKPYEIRSNTDRDYQVGDMVIMCEYFPNDMGYSGKEVIGLISYLSGSGEWGLPEGLCVFGVHLIANYDAATNFHVHYHRSERETREVLMYADRKIKERQSLKHVDPLTAMVLEELNKDE